MEWKARDDEEGKKKGGKGEEKGNRGMVRIHFIPLVTVVLISYDSRVIKELSHEYSTGDADEGDEELGGDEKRI